MVRFFAVGCLVTLVGAVISVGGVASASGNWSGADPLSGDYGHCNAKVEYQAPGVDQTLGATTDTANGWSLAYACQAEIPSGDVVKMLDQYAMLSGSRYHYEMIGYNSADAAYELPYGQYQPTGACGVGRVYWMGSPNVSGVAGFATTNAVGVTCTAPFSAFSQGNFVTGGDQGMFGFGSGVGGPPMPSYFNGTAGALDSFGEVTGATYGSTVTSGNVAVAFTGWISYPECDDVGGSTSYGGTLGYQCPGTNQPYYSQNMFNYPSSTACLTGSYAPSLPIHGPTMMYAGAGNGRRTLTLDTVSCGWVGSVGPSMPSSYFTGGSSTPPVTPCSLVSVSGDATQTGDGSTSYPLSVTYTGPASELVMDPNDGGSIGGLTVHGQPFSGDSKVNTAPSSPWHTSAVFASGQSVGNAEFWCYYQGTWYWGTTVTGVVGGPPGGAFNLGACLSSSLGSMSLTDPVSWVTGIGSSMGCVLQWLFIPDAAAVSGISTQFGVSSSTPSIGTDSASQWLGSFVQGVAAMPGTALTSIQTAADGGSCALPGDPSFSIGGHSFVGCDALTGITPGHAPTSGGNTALAVLRDFLTAGFYLEVTIGLFMFLRKVLAAGS
jgi:hypothetical protein